MPAEIAIGNRIVGRGRAVYIAAEIGINHNGDLDLAKRIVDAGAAAKCDAVKFQKRTPEVCVPDIQRGRLRETPWGIMTYLDYRRRIEFGRTEYQELERHCRERGIDWFASVWDEESVDFMEDFAPLLYKIPSACLTDAGLLTKVRRTGRPVVLSTGMSSMDQIRAAAALLGTDNLLILHCTSSYPCAPAELNLRAIQTLMREFPDSPIGYSGHEVGLVTTVAAVALGACFIERHVTLDRALWGSDQSASIEPGGLQRLVTYIRTLESGLGDGVKRVYESEHNSMQRLRRLDTLAGQGESPASRVAG